MWWTSRTLPLLNSEWGQELAQWETDAGQSAGLPHQNREIENSIRSTAKKDPVRLRPPERGKEMGEQQVFASHNLDVNRLCFASLTLYNLWAASAVCELPKHLQMWFLTLRSLTQTELKSNEIVCSYCWLLFRECMWNTTSVCFVIECKYPHWKEYSVPVLLTEVVWGELPLQASSMTQFSCKINAHIKAVKTAICLYVCLWKQVAK